MKPSLGRVGGPSAADYSRTIMWVLAILAAGCGGSDPLAGLPALPFEQSGAPAVSLDRLPGRYELPSSNLDVEPSARREVNGFSRLRDGSRVWVADLPFDLPTSGPSKATPSDLVIRRGEEVVGWDGSLRDADPDTGAWRLQDGKLHFLAREAPPDGVITVETPGLAARQHRLELGASGLVEPEAFARYTDLQGDVSRSGLLIPAPGHAEIEVEIPKEGSFEAGLQLVKPPLESSRSDGVTFVLSVVAGGAESEVGRSTVSSAGAEPTPLSFDLSAWSGQTVTLKLASEPGGNNVHDWMFLTAPVVRAKPVAKPRRVIVLAVDTLRPDHLGSYGYAKPTSPELDALAATSVVFEDAWAPAPRTRPSFRTATTGRWPLEAVGATNLGEMFDAAGFATAGIVANVHLTPRFDFHAGYDLWWLDPEAKADDQVDRALAWLEANRTRDTFLFLHIMDPHLPYDAPGSWRDTFVTVTDPKLPVVFNRWQVYNWERRGELTEDRKTHIQGLYDSEIAWTSSQIGRFVDGLDRDGGNTLLVFHTDHGEELWDHGGFEHNHTLYDEVVRTALWFRVPGAKPSRETMPASLADIAPTLVDYAGLQEPPEFDGISLRPWLDGDAPPAERPLPVGFLRYDRERWGVIADDHKYVLWTEDGREELYDLGADPGEKNDLSGTADLAPYRAALSASHGIPVGPGWRLEVQMKPGAAPITVELPAECVSAGVIDPESTSRRPVNQEWGEVPPKLPADVGTVVLAEDRRSFVYTPGPQPEGLLYVLFDGPMDVTKAVVRRDGKVQQRALGTTTRVSWSLGEERLKLSAGTIVVPPLDEAWRMAELAKKHGAADAGDLELLKSLGYIGDEH
jgi:arylsulfatase A-like enzyme